MNDDATLVVGERPEPKTFGSLLRKIREDSGKSMGDLARALPGLTVLRVASLEHDKEPPPSNHEIKQIAEALGVDPQSLLEMSCNEQGPQDLTAAYMAGVEKGKAISPSRCHIQTYIDNMVRAGEDRNETIADLKPEIAYCAGLTSDPPVLPAAGPWRTDDPPRDGTPILALFESNGLNDPILAYFDIHKRRWGSDDNDYLTFDDEPKLWAEIRLPEVEG